MATPKARVIQCIGRVQRPCPTKQSPLVLDVADDVGVFEQLRWKRQRLYGKEGATPCRSFRPRRRRGSGSPEASKNNPGLGSTMGYDERCACVAMIVLLNSVGLAATLWSRPRQAQVSQRKRSPLCSGHLRNVCSVELQPMHTNFPPCLTTRTQRTFHGVRNSRSPCAKEQLESVHRPCSWSAELDLVGHALVAHVPLLTAPEAYRAVPLGLHVLGDVLRGRLDVHLPGHRTTRFSPTREFFFPRRFKHMQDCTGDLLVPGRRPGGGLGCRPRKRPRDHRACAPCLLRSRSSRGAPSRRCRGAAPRAPRCEARRSSPSSRSRRRACSRGAPSASSAATRCFNAASWAVLAILSVAAAGLATVLIVAPRAPRAGALAALVPAGGAIFGDWALGGGWCSPARGAPRRRAAARVPRRRGPPRATPARARAAPRARRRAHAAGAAGRRARAGRRRGRAPALSWFSVRD